METSQLFAVSRNTIFKTLICNPSTGWMLWLVLFIGLALTVFGCIADVRCVILGLIICLTVAPSMAFFIFVNYMFATEMVANLLDHTVERHPHGYLVRIYRPVGPDEHVEDGKTWIECGMFTLFDSNIVKEKTTNQYKVIFLKDSPLSILYVPIYLQEANITSCSL